MLRESRAEKSILLSAPRALAPTMKQHFLLLATHGCFVERLWLFMEPGSRA